MTQHHSGFTPSARSIWALLGTALLVLQNPAFGWVYPEHREIMARAIRELDARRHGQLTRLWDEARRGHELRLSATPADTPGFGPPATLDLASWPAIAADHSTSAADMVHNVLETDWILKVAAVTHRLNAALSWAGLERHARTNALRDADLSLLRADPEYASHAGANNAHFLLARPESGTTLEEYILDCIRPGAEFNATGIYSWYHVQALRKAERYAKADLADSTKARLALAALADEAFAIHFLQDMFAAGHAAGTRGDASVRKGTHDYYNEHGMEARTWDGRSMVVKGDAWMRDQDARWTAAAVRASLEQFLLAAEGKMPPLLPPLEESESHGPDTLDIGRLTIPHNPFLAGGVTLIERVMLHAPIPGLAEGDGELPRFRSELGLFIGVVPALRGAITSGGFSTLQTTHGAVGGLELAARMGLGLDGVLNESGDGLVFLDLGMRLDAASSIPLSQQEYLSEFGSILAAIPSRAAFTTRVRVPLWLIPMDLLLAGPILGAVSPEDFTRMAAVAANGGLIPWQAGIATSIGRFQFILGREVGVAFYGYLKHEDRFLLPYGETGSGPEVLASLRSVQLEFPIVEYMPFRTFATDQSSSLVIQLFYSLDIPTRTAVVVAPAGDEVGFKSVWQIGLRAAFRWRHYW